MYIYIYIYIWQCAICFAIRNLVRTQRHSKILKIIFEEGECQKATKRKKEKKFFQQNTSLFSQKNTFLISQKSTSLFSQQSTSLFSQ